VSKTPLVMTVSKEMIARIDRETRTYTATMELRLATPDRTTTRSPRLQQAFHWRSAEDGGIEWRDVPIVVVDD